MKFQPQFDSSDCGAACIAMIASHFGSSLTVTKIRQTAGTDRHGTNLKGMLSAAESLGFEAKALKNLEKDLENEIPVPFIAHFGDVKQNHYVVVSRIEKKRVLVFDPAQKKHYMKLADFLTKWSGYAIFLNPTPEFVPVKEEKGNLLRYLPLLRPHVKTIFLVMLASVLLTVLGIVGSFYFQFLVDEVLGSKAEVTLHVLSVGIILLTLFQVLLGAVRNQILVHFSLKTSMALSFTYLKHVLSLPLGFFDSRKVGEILSRFGDGAKIRGILSNVALSILLDVGMMIFAGVYLGFQNSTLFLLSLAALPLSTAVIWGFSKTFRENYRKGMVQEAESQSFMVEALNGMGTVKGLNATDQAFFEMEKRIVKGARTGFQSSTLGNIQGILIGLIEGWGGNILFWVGAWFILKDQITLGQLMSFNALSGFFIGPLKRLLGLQPAIQEALVAADRLGEILELEPEIVTDRPLIAPERFQGRIELKEVSFRYGSRRLVLEDLSLTIEPGSKVAFVGPSGCGKSTLVKLLLKFYRPEKGELFVDGHNVLDLDTLNLRAKIGYVPQEVFLFSGTVRENIALHRPDASFEEVVEAAKRAQAHDFIELLPDRYESELAERGSSLSGGERQRLALARAILGNPDVLLFDEATSSLDTIAEKAVHETIRELTEGGMTTILVAHRLSTVIACDKIFVLDRGRLVEEGNHFELVRRGGHYAKLWEGQKG